jgi:hypothetical protein
MFTPNGGTVQKAAIIPGLVAKKLAGEVVDLAANAWAASTAQYRPFGLFANYVGGEMTDIPSDFDRVGIWRGAGSVYELLAPSWDDTGLSSTAPDEDGTAAEEVYLVPNSVGQLVESGSDESDPSNPVNTAARLMTRLSANAIVIELLV